MKLKKSSEKTVDIKTIAKRHAVFGEIITTNDAYLPCFVLHSYFEPQYIEKYGYDSEELLKHGTGYIDCLTGCGRIIRRQYYEYAIIVHSKKISQKFRKKFPQLEDKNGFSYRVMQYIQSADESIVI